MFKMTVSYRKGEKIEKQSFKDFETFIEACHMAEDFGEDAIVEVLIHKQAE